MIVLKPGSWASILSIFLFGVLGGATLAKLIPLGVDIERAFGASPAAFGLLVSFLGVPAALLAIPGGIVVDRYGPRIVLLVSAGAGVLANLIYLVADALPLFFIARFIEGAAIVFAYAAGPALLMGTVQGRRCTTAMTVWATYMPAGTALGLVLGGLFAGGEAWRMTFAAHAALQALALLIGLLLPAAAPLAPAARFTERMTQLHRAYSRTPLLLLAACFFLLVSLGLGASTAFPGYLARAHSISTAAASGMTALATLAMIPGALAVGVMLSRGADAQRLFLVGAGLAIAFGSLSFAPGVPTTARFVVLLAWFAISGAAMALVMAVLPSIAEPERRGAATALLNQAGAIATLLNPPLWLSLAAAGDWRPFLGLMALGWALAAASIALLLARRTEDGAATRAYSKSERRNLALVAEMYENVLQPLDADQVDRYFVPGYIQHNPMAATGADGLKAFLAWAKARSPNAEHIVKRVFADGDFVIAHVHVIIEPGTRGNAVIDIFRIEDGLIAEHWDAAQPIPESMPHANGVF
ncbi:MAG: MFS transporter [Hydrogenophilaceae bacterium]|jgi:predicted SnoaL-like aldol condensation-catalyzing enzyme|nr:MFS transporter [Hydrogenophilaceae bacterium]